VRPIGGVNEPLAVRIGGSARTVASSGERAEEATDETSRALIPISAVTAARETPISVRRADAGFLAHLIATAGQMPQTRERRRAAPEDAIAAYRSTVNGLRMPAPSRLSRSS
jgi:hypothetical protein